MDIEISISPSGEIVSSWWSEEIKKIICAVCGKCTEGINDNKIIVHCMMANALCG